MTDLLSTFSRAYRNAFLVSFAAAAFVFPLIDVVRG